MRSELEREIRLIRRRLFRFYGAMVTLSTEVWCEIFAYFPDIKDAIKTWIAFGLRNVISKQHEIWMFLLVDLLKDSTISNLLMRSNFPTLPAEKQGLVFLSRINHKKKCSRTGCFQQFTEIQNNSNTCCRYHTGKMTSAGYLSCCREKSFRSKGCKTGHHCGDFYDYVFSERADTDKKYDVTTAISRSDITSFQKIADPPSELSSAFLPLINGCQSNLHAGNICNLTVTATEVQEGKADERGSLFYNGVTGSTSCKQTLESADDKIFKEESFRLPPLLPSPRSY